MREKALRTCVGAVLVAVCYVAYVCVTHADGVVFASAVGAISGLVGFAVGSSS